MFTLFIHTVWASILALGWIKFLVAVAVLVVLSKIHHLLGTLGFIIFIAYLAHWI